MKNTDNKKIIITEKGNNSNVAVSVRCGCLCDSLFFENGKKSSEPQIKLIKGFHRFSNKIIRVICVIRKNR